MLIQHDIERREHLIFSTCFLNRALARVTRCWPAESGWETRPTRFGLRMHLQNDRWAATYTGDTYNLFELWSWARKGSKRRMRRKFRHNDQIEILPQTYWHINHQLYIGRSSVLFTDFLLPKIWFTDFLLSKLWIILKGVLECCKALLTRNKTKNSQTIWTGHNFSEPLQAFDSLHIDRFWKWWLTSCARTSMKQCRLNHHSQRFRSGFQILLKHKEPPSILKVAQTWL